jgi:hypothetical protein
VRNQFEVTIEAPAERLHPLLADLERYPEFLDIVDRVEIDPTPTADESGTAWLVTLRARIGPLARSKRLRMVRTVTEPGRIRFERRELDGRHHADWILEATLRDTSDPEVAEALESEGPATLVAMALDYDGRLWSGPVEAVLRSEVPGASARLTSLATAPA